MTPLLPQLKREAASKLHCARFAIAPLSLALAGLIVTVAVLKPAPVHLHTERVYAYTSGPTPAPAALPCAEDTPATEQTDTSLPLHALRRPWLGVAASSAHNTIALWTKDEIAVSTDGGVRAELIASDDEILSLAIDEKGKVWILTSHESRPSLQTITDTKLISASLMPMTMIGQPESFTASANAVVVVAFESGAADAEQDEEEDFDGSYVDPRMHIFNPTRHTWSKQELPSWGNAGNSIRVRHDGSIDYMAGYEASCGGGYQSHFRARLGEEEWQEVEWPMDVPYGFVIGEAGWAYAIDSSCIEQQSDETKYTLCATSPEGKLERVLGSDATNYFGDGFLLASNDKTQYAAIEGKLANVNGKRSKTVATLPAPAISLAVDHQGDALMMSRDNLWHWSSKAGWTSLAPRLVPEGE